MKHQNISSTSVVQQLQRSFLPILTVLFAMAGGTMSAQEPPPKGNASAKQEKQLTDYRATEATTLLDVKRQAKQQRLVRQPKLVQRLEARLIEATEQAAAEGAKSSVASLQASGVRLQDDKVIVLVECEKGGKPEDVARAISASGGTVIRTGESHVKAAIPVPVLEVVAREIPGVSFVRTPDRPRGKNAVITEGLAKTLAGPWLNAGITGQGVKVAIIDYGFAGLATLKANDEIPASAIEVDFSGEGMEAGTSRHGCSCAEVVYDMAPGCQLYLLKAADISDDEAAKNYCKAQGVQIISNSGGYDAMNFHDGMAYSSISPHPVTVVNDAVQNGILWVNAAGNEELQHAMAGWRDAGADRYLDWSATNGGYNELYDGAGATVPVGTVIAGYLTWNEWPVTDQDFDLLLRYWNGSNWTTVKSGANYQTGTQAPRESLSYTVTTAGTLVENYAFFVVKDSATRSPAFILRTYPYELFYYGYGNYLTPSPGSICIPADAASSFSVGAINHASYPGGPIMRYSSLGPNNGAYTGNTTVVKPDICGPSGVGTSTNGTNGFGGTSSSTPHIAGLAALVKQRFPSYTPAQTRSYIESYSIDLGTPGKDNTYGAGAAVLPGPPPPPPVITITGTLAAVSTTYGSASPSPTSFTVSGTNLTNVLAIGALSGFEYCPTIDGSYTSSLSLTPTSGTVATTTVYVRLAATAGVGSSPYSGNIVCSSTGAASVNAVTVSSTVSKKALTVTAPSIASKPYNGTTAPGAVTVGTLSGFVAGQTVTASAVAAAYPSANVGSYPGIVITYTLANGTGGGLAANYSLASGTATGSVTPLALSIGPPTIASRAYNGTTAPGAVTVGTLSGFVSGQTVTATGAAAAYPSANVGSYPGVVITYTLANGTGGGLAANYSLANGSATGVITGTYTVTYDANGGTSPSPATTSVTYATTYGTLATTTRTGYTFGGWWTGAGGTGTEVTTTTTVTITADQTLYANWLASVPVIASVSMNAAKDTLTLGVSGLINGHTYYIESGTTLADFTPLAGSQFIASGGTVTRQIPVNPVTTPKRFIRLVEGPMP